MYVKPLERPIEPRKLRETKNRGHSDNTETFDDIMEAVVVDAVAVTQPRPEDDKPKHQPQSPRKERASDDGEAARQGGLNIKA